MGSSPALLVIEDDDAWPGFPVSGSVGPQVIDSRSLLHVHTPQDLPSKFSVLR